ncbi:uncharacterized protein LOC141619504 isoform X2 [Silene latifolia]
MSSGWEWDFKVPSHIIEKMEPYEIPTREDDAAYFRAEYYGLYEYTCDTDDSSNSELKKIAVSTVSSSVVGVSSFGLGFRPYHSSGIIVEHNNVKLILTSGYILGDGSKTPKVTIILYNKKEVNAYIVYTNVDHNIVLLRAQQELDDETTSARFSTDLPESGTLVMAVGRHYHGKLMASSGTINNRGDHLESDDLMSSTSNISEWGIGGALVERSTGTVIGMNFFCTKGYTPFMPSNILIKCVKHLIETGDVSRPWLGLRTRSIDEVDIQETEAIYRKFQSFDGIVVKEVIKGSPTDMAGICVGNVITSCNKISINSPAEFAGVLFKLVEDKQGNLITAERREALEVELIVNNVQDGSAKARVLHVQRFTPPIPNNWPVLPIPSKSKGESIFSRMR